MNKSPKIDPSTVDSELLEKLNRETSKIAWSELQRFFAQGAAVYVSPELDLLKVAVEISKDNAKQLEAWMQNNQVHKVTDFQAEAWLEQDLKVWAVVDAPWVLVQLAQ